MGSVTYSVQMVSTTIYSLKAVSLKWLPVQGQYTEHSEHRGEEPPIAQVQPEVHRWSRLEDHLQHGWVKQLEHLAGAFRSFLFLLDQFLTQEEMAMVFSGHLHYNILICYSKNIFSFS